MNDLFRFDLNMFKDYMDVSKYEIERHCIELPQMTVIRDMLEDKFDNGQFINDMLEVMLYHILSERNMGLHINELFNTYDMGDYTFDIEVIYDELTFLTQDLFVGLAGFDIMNLEYSPTVIVEEVRIESEEVYVLRYAIIRRKESNVST